MAEQTELGKKKKNQQTEKTFCGQNWDGKIKKVSNDTGYTAH